MMRFALLPALLSATALGLTATLVVLMASPAPEYETPPVPKRDRPAVSLPEPFAPPPLATFQEIDERPLFMPRRRPFKEPEREPPPPEPRKPPEATLIGVILDGKRRVAIAKAGGKSVILVPGTDLNGWEVVSIEADRVAFRADDDIHEIRLPKPIAGAPAPPRPAGQPQPSRMPPPPGYAPGPIPGRP